MLQCITIPCWFIQKHSATETEGEKWGQVLLYTHWFYFHATRNQNKRTMQIVHQPLDAHTNDLY